MKPLWWVLYLLCAARPHAANLCITENSNLTSCDVIELDYEDACKDISSELNAHVNFINGITHMTVNTLNSGVFTCENIMIYEGHTDSCWRAELAGYMNVSSIRIEFPEKQFQISSTMVNYSKHCKETEKRTRQLPYNLLTNSFTRTISLTVYTKTMMKWNVTMYHSNCSLTCSPQWNTCRPEQETYITKTNDSLNIPDLPFGNYCFMIHTGFGDVYTHTVMLEDIPVRDHHLVIPKSNETVIAVAATVIVFMAIGSIYFVRFIVHRDRIPLKPLDSSQTQDSDLESKLLDSQPTVLLLYSRDSKEFARVIETFATMLSKCFNFKVLDPFDKDQMEEVFLNPSAWIVRHINSPSVKVVIVISEGAIIRQQALLLNEVLHLQDPHCLDSIFLYALQYLHENPIISRDYQRIFTVRLNEVCKSTWTLPLIVPLKCFVLPNRLGALVNEIRGEPALREMTLEELKMAYANEVEKFQTTVSQMKEGMQRPSV